MKKLAQILLAIIIFTAIKLYNKSSANDEVKSQLLNACNGSEVCEQIVENNFDVCFDNSYSIGTKRRAGSLNAHKLSECLNSSLGMEYFSVSKEN